MFTPNRRLPNFRIPFGSIAPDTENFEPSFSRISAPLRPTIQGEVLQLIGLA
jgi:hypothetical protein